MLRFGLFKKRGFDVCINRSDGFNGHGHHMKVAPESSPPAFLYNWRQWYLQACFNFIGVDFLKKIYRERILCARLYSLVCKIL